MTTARLWVSNAVRRNSDAAEILTEFADENGITGRDYLHLSLLAEETLGMASQILHVYDGELLIEKTAAGYEIILEADVRESSNGTPSLSGAPEGFMAKIAEMLNCSYVFENISEMPDNLAVTLPDYLSCGFRDPGQARAWAGQWSLSAYRYHLLNDSTPGINPAELEKSVVASLADDVTIGIRGRRIRLAISKKAAGGR